MANEKQHEGHVAEETREAAERALRGEHDALPASELTDGGHARSHAAHLEIPEETPRTKPEGSVRDENYPGNRRRP